MTKFIVMVEGRNCWIRNANTDSSERVGFFTTRYVEAVNQTEACALALNLVRAELTSLDLNTNALALDPPVLLIDEVYAVDSFETNSPGKGFTFYPEEAH